MRGYGELIEACQNLTFTHSGSLAMMWLKLPELQATAPGLASLADFGRFMESWPGALEFDYGNKNGMFYFRPGDPSSSALIQNYIESSMDAFVTLGRFHELKDGRTLIVRGECTGEVRSLLTRCITDAAPNAEIPRAVYSHSGLSVTTQFDDPLLVAHILKRIFRLRRERYSPLRDLKIYRE